MKWHPKWIIGCLFAFLYSLLFLSYDFLDKTNPPNLLSHSLTTYVPTTSPGHIALSWSSCSEPLPKFQKQYPKLKFWISEISMQPVFYYLAFCIANHFILPKSTRKQVNDPNWQKNFNNLWISQYFKIK